MIDTEMTWGRGLGPIVGSLAVLAILFATPAHADSGLALPDDLSVAGMLRQADGVVRGVILLLILASLASWTVLLAKGSALLLGNRRLRRAIHVAEDQAGLTSLLGSSERNGHAAAQMARAAMREVALSRGLPLAGIKERVYSRLHLLEVGGARRMARGTGIVATTGAVAPFVGLFGTVWGIMNSFIGIAHTHATNLSVVAPGIAEALLATAAGLVAAIPAVIIYNLFARALGAHRGLLADLSATIARLVSRDLDRGADPVAAE
jgi:biopolymer transport protein ExbB